MNETGNETIAGNETTVKRTNRLLKIVIFLVIVLLIICGGAYCYFSFLLDSTKIVADSVNKIYKSGMSLYTDMGKYYGPFNVKGNVEYKTYFEGLDEESSTKLDYNVGVDYNSKKLVSTFDLMYGLQKLSASVNYEKDKAYINVVDIFPRIMLVDLSKYSKKVNIDKTMDYEYILDLVVNTTIDSINSSLLTKSIVTETINGKNQIVLSINYDLNSDEQIKILENVFSALSKDDKAVSIMCDITSCEDKQDLKEGLSEMEFEDNLEDIKIVIMSNLISKELVKISLDSKYCSFDMETDNNIYTIGYISEYGEEKNNAGIVYNKELGTVKGTIINTNTEEVTSKDEFDCTIKNNSDTSKNIDLNFTSYNDINNKKDYSKVIISSTITYGAKLDDFDKEGASLYKNWSKKEKSDLNKLLGNLIVLK